MERQDAKPRRPSLMAGGTQPPPAASPARILAEMEGPATAAPRSPSGRPRRWLLAVAAAGIALGAIAWLWPATPSGGIANRGDSPAQAPSAAATDPAATAATIIDEPLPAATSGTGESAPAMPTAAADAPGQAPVIAPSPFAAVAAARQAAPRSTDNPFDGAGPPPRQERKRPAPAAAGNAPAAGNSGPELLATLLRNIHSEPAPASGESELDQLVGRLDKAAAQPAAAEAGGGATFRSQQIQSNLRECPPPNTPQGVKCRQEICAVYAGRDPACPAN